MKTFFQLREQAGQVTVGDYTTKHFDICPSAVKLYSNIKNMTPMVHLVVENMMLHDLFFRLEKQAIAQGSIDMDDLEKADHYAEMIMDNAEQMGLEEEHSYIEDVHMAKFEQLAGMSDDEENESEMNEKTLTKAELKKREEVAKAIERENPNMPMAKKMAIATATAKKVAEDVELAELSKKTLGNYIKVAGPDRERRMKNATNLSNVGHDIRDQDHKQANKLFSRAGAEIHKAANRKAGINKAVNKLVGEEAEQIDEISRDLARSYIRKATADNKERRSEVMKPFNSKDMDKNVSQYKKMKSREKGIETAGKKAYDIGGKAKVPARESVELDELNKSTLGSYIKKASGNMAGNAAVGAAQASSSMKKSSSDVKRNIKNRMTGIAKATDKLTKEEANLDEVSSTTLMNYSIKAARQGMKRVAGQKTADEKMRKKDGYSSTAKVAAGPARRESVELDEGISNLSHSRLKFHATKGVPHGSYSNKEIKDEHNRRMRTEPDYVKAKASMNEEVELDEVSQAMKDRYIQKSISSHGHNAAVASDAKSRGDQATYDKARKIMKKRNQGMTRAFGGERA